MVAEHENTCDLAAGSPSATVAAWHITGSDLEYLVLCDSSLLLSFTDGRHLEVTDDRLNQVVEPWVEAALAKRAQSGLSDLATRSSRGQQAGSGGAAQHP